MIEEDHHRYSKDYGMDELFDTLELFNTASTVAEAVPSSLAAASSSSANVFLSDVDFEQLAATRRVTEEAIDWLNLPIGAIYHVHSILPIKTKWGAQSILVLRNKDGVGIKVWAPVNVSKELKSGIKLNNNNSSNVYIKSLGQKETKTSTGGRKRYFDFDAVYV